MANNKQPAISGPVVRCPKCGRKQPFRTPDAMYRCGPCGVTFDCDPNEGGDYSDHNASARLERAEREQERRRGRGPGSDNRIHRHARGYR